MYKMYVKKFQKPIIEIWKNAYNNYILIYVEKKCILFTSSEYTKRYFSYNLENLVIIINLKLSNMQFITISKYLGESMK